MTGRKTISKVVTTVVATIALITSLTMVATPASASSCVPTLDQPCSDWMRVQKAGITVDYKVDITGGDFIIQPGAYGGTYFTVIYWPDAYPEQTGSDRGGIRRTIPCPGAGVVRHWSFSVASPQLDGSWARFSETGTTVCGGPAATSPTVDNRPTVLAPDMTSWQATQVCRNRGRKWVARKKSNWRKIVRWNKTHDPDQNIWRCVKLRRKRSITS